MNTVRKYTCENCLQQYETGWTDEEASIEFSERFEEEDVRDAAIVCDDCYKRIMGDAA